MSYEELCGHVAAVISEIQERSGRDCPVVVPATRPLRDVPGFDSLNAIEAQVLLSQRLAFRIPDDSILFLDEATYRPLTVAQIANRLRTIVSEVEVSHGS